jgi:hypothetical protein
MHCYYHPVTDAVAICRSCGRGVCTACAAEVGKATACRGRCEADVAAITRMLTRNAAAFEHAAETFHRVAMLTALIAAIFFAFGYVMRARGVAWMFYMATGIMLLVSLTSILIARRYTRSA